MCMGLQASFGRHIPDNLIDLVVLQLVKDSVRAYEHVIKIVHTILLVSDLRIASDHPTDPAQVSQLSLAVSKRSTDRESARKDAVGANEGVLFIIAILGWWHCLLFHLVCLGGRQAILHHCLGLVDVATCRYYPVELFLIGGLVVS